MSDNINFTLLGTDEIRNDTYYNYSSGADFFADQEGHTDLNGDGKFDVFSVNSHSDAIDIYLFANDKLNFGLAANIPGTSLVIGGNAFNTNLVSSHVLSHEVAHGLGLFHTFHGGIFEPAGSCAELVDGSNGTTCGDFVQDSPADPYPINRCSTSNQSDCTWGCSSSYMDANGANYNPNTHLYMSYTFPNCMNLHTSGQVARMFSTIANSCLLQRTLVMTITGPTIVCASGATFTVNNLPSGWTVSWPQINNLSLLSASGITAVYNAIGSGPTTLQATINTSTCGIITLIGPTVWVGAPLPVISGPTTIKKGITGTYTINNASSQSITSYLWDCSGSLAAVGSTTSSSFRAKGVSCGLESISCNAGNNCGNSDTYTEVNVFCVGGFAFTLSPNPGSDNVEIAITDDQAVNDTNNLVNEMATEKVKPDLAYTIRIFNSISALQSTATRIGKNFSIPINNLPNGSYVIEVSDGKTSSRQQLIVKHN